MGRRDPSVPPTATRAWGWVLFDTGRLFCAHSRTFCGSRCTYVRTGTRGTNLAFPRACPNLYACVCCSVRANGRACFPFPQNAWQVPRAVGLLPHEEQRQCTCPDCPYLGGYTGPAGGPWAVVFDDISGLRDPPPKSRQSGHDPHSPRPSGLLVASIDRGKIGAQIGALYPRGTPLPWPLNPFQRPAPILPRSCLDQSGQGLTGPSACLP